MREGQQSYRIFFFSVPHEIEIAKTQVTTLLDLKRELQRITFLDIDDQKLVLNREIIKKDDTTHLADVGISQKDKLRLLTKTPHTLIEYQSRRRILQEKDEGKVKMKQQSVKAEVQDNMQLIKKQIKSYPILSNLTEVLVSKIARSIFKRKIWKGRDEKLVGQKGFLSFVLEKIAKDHKLFDHIFEKRERQICRLLLEDELSSAEAEKRVQTVDTVVCDKLVAMGYKAQKAKESLQRSQNSLSQALQILYYGRDVGEFEFQEVLLDQLDECCAIFRWLMCKQNLKLRVRLSMSELNFWLYLNSLRYRCVRLYQMMNRHRVFVLKLLSRPLPRWIFDGYVEEQ